MPAESLRLGGFSPCRYRTGENRAPSGYVAAKQRASFPSLRLGGVEEETGNARATRGGAGPPRRTQQIQVATRRVHESATRPCEHLRPATKSQSRLDGSTRALLARGNTPPLSAGHCATRMAGVCLVTGRIQAATRHCRICTAVGTMRVFLLGTTVLAELSRRGHYCAHAECGRVTIAMHGTARACSRPAAEVEPGSPGPARRGGRENSRSTRRTTYGTGAAGLPPGRRLGTCNPPGARIRPRTPTAAAGGDAKQPHEREPPARQKSPEAEAWWPQRGPDPGHPARE